MTIPVIHRRWRQISHETLNELLAYYDYRRIAFSDGERYEHVHNGQVFAVTKDGQVFVPPEDSE